MKTFLVKEIITIEKCYEVEAEDKYDANDEFLNGNSKRAPKCDTGTREYDFIELADKNEKD